MLPPPPPRSLRLEVRLVRPFSRVASVLEEVLLSELAAVLGVGAVRLQLTDLRCLRRPASRAPPRLSARAEACAR